MTIGVVHPGEMGAAIAAALRAAGHTVLWASSGRSAATTARAEHAGLEDAGTSEELSRRSDVVLSVCPPHAAVDVARSFAGYPGVYVDANAVSPATARRIAGLVRRYIADAFLAAGLPDGFHRAAADIYRRGSHADANGRDELERVLSALGENA